MRLLLLVVLLGFGASMASSSAAAFPLGPGPLPMDPTPRAPNAIEVDYEFELLPSLDAFDLSGTFAVREVAVASEGVSAQAIRDGTDLARKRFEAGFQEVVEAELKAAFLESPPIGTVLAFRYGESNADANPYDPPIFVDMDTHVLLNPGLLGMHSTKVTDGADLARAFLFSGGQATIDRSVAVPAGFNARFEVTVPEFLRLSDAKGMNSTSLVFPEDNTRGAVESKLRMLFAIGLRPDALPANVLAGPTVRATFVAHDDTGVLVRALPWSSGSYSADLDLWIEVPSLSASYFGHSPLPSNLKTSHYSADLLRVAVRERLVTAEDVHTFFASLIEDGLREGFGESAEIEMDKQAFRDSVAKPIGGADGRTIAPLLIHAQAKLPLTADKMVMGSALAQTLGSITRIPAKFPVANEGSWILDLTLLYPEGVTVTVEDSEGLAEKTYGQGREGVHVLLQPGETTDVKVHGRPAIDALILVIGLVEVGLLTAGITWLVLRGRRLLAARRPWAPRQ